MFLLIVPLGDPTGVRNTVNSALSRPIYCMSRGMSLLVSPSKSLEVGTVVCWHCAMPVFHRAQSLLRYQHRNSLCVGQTYFTTAKLPKPFRINLSIRDSGCDSRLRPLTLARVYSKVPRVRSFVSVRSTAKSRWIAYSFCPEASASYYLNVAETYCLRAGLSRSTYRIKCIDMRWGIQR
jgi:hypothetical protein